MLFDTPFPTERIALFYIPLFSVSTVSCIDELACNFEGKSFKGFVSVVFVVLSMFAFVHFVRTFNIKHTYAWFYDSNTKAAMIELDSDLKERFAGKSIFLGINWVFEPSIYYYATVYFPYLRTPVARSGVNGFKDAYYCFLSDLAKIPVRARSLQTIKEFHNTETVLLKNLEALGLRNLVKGKTVPSN
jgi:hypothetical protein